MLETKDGVDYVQVRTRMANTLTALAALAALCCNHCADHWLCCLLFAASLRRSLAGMTPVLVYFGRTRTFFFFWVRSLLNNRVHAGTNGCDVFVVLHSYER